MKKIIILSLLCFPAFFLKGQATYNDSREDFLSAIQRNKSYRDHIASGHITSVRIVGYKHNDTIGFLKYESKYDIKGNNTDVFTYKNRKIKNHSFTKYDDSNRVTEFAYYKRGDKLKYMYVHIYDKSGNPIEQDSYKKNAQEVTSKTIKTYDNFNNITEAKTFDGSGKLKSRIEYTYYNDGSKKQTTQYSGKGKIVRIWNFDCNPVGKLQAKKFKDTAKICIHYETDASGNPIKVKEEYLSGGFLGGALRNVTKFDKDNNTIDAACYNLNGKLFGHWSASYNPTGRMTEYVVYKGGTLQTRFKVIYSYDDKGNISESVTYKKSKVPFSTMKYVYTSSLSVPAK